MDFGALGMGSIAAACGLACERAAPVLPGTPIGPADQEAYGHVPMPDRDRPRTTGCVAQTPVLIQLLWLGRSCA